MLEQLFEQLALKDVTPTLIPVVGLLVLMMVIFWVAKRAVRRWATHMEEEDREHIEEIERWANQLISIIRYSAAIIAGLGAVLIVLRGLGIQGIPEVKWEQVTGWLLSHGVRIVFVLGGAYVVTRVLHLLITRLRIFIVPEEGPLAELAERKKRAQTVSRLMKTLVSVVVMGIAGLMVLREVGVDVTPILTGAGIAGLAVGFGAQNVVRDVISGFFLILENHVRVGDVAIINGKGGLVENIRLRTIVLRGLDGTVHVFHNGAVTELSNMTKDFSYYVIDMGVAYKENVDHVADVLREVGEELRNDPKFSASILGPLEILGVDAFADSAVVIKVRIKTVALQQWNVGRELRRRIKNTFDAKGIEIPYPHLSVYYGEASKPFAVQVAEKMGKA